MSFLYAMTPFITAAFSFRFCITNAGKKLGFLFCHTLIFSGSCGCMQYSSWDGLLYISLILLLKKVHLGILADISATLLK